MATRRQAVSLGALAVVVAIVSIRAARAEAGATRKRAHGTAATEGRASPSATTTRVTYRVRRGAAVDLGWTGISHGQAWPSGQHLQLDLSCAAGRSACKARGGGTGVVFGPPIPLSSGGIPVCVVNRLRDAITGELDVASGCGTLTLRLAASVLLAQYPTHPCPVCVGDRVVSDGRKEGRCEGGANDGTACDAQGESAAFGATSSDCEPRGTPIGTLPIDLAPLTTGAAGLEAARTCAGPAAAARCFCAAQTAPNACRSGVCDGGTCSSGPVDGTCTGAPFRSCMPGSGAADCEARFPGAGTCENRPRPCFAETIGAQGVCDRHAPTFVATFCTPATAAPSLNATAGLPGPARLILPLESVDATADAGKR